MRRDAWRVMADMVEVAAVLWHPFTPVFVVGGADIQADIVMVAVRRPATVAVSPVPPAAVLPVGRATAVVIMTVDTAHAVLAAVRTVNAM